MSQDEDIKRLVEELSPKHRAFLAGLAEHGRLSAPTGQPPVMSLARSGLILFVHRSEDLSVMEITDAGRQALASLTTKETDRG